MRTVTVSKSMIQDFKHSPQPQLKLKLKKITPTKEKSTTPYQLLYKYEVAKTNSNELYSNSDNSPAELGNKSFEVKLRNTAKSCERLLDI